MIEHLLSTYGYVAIFLITFLEGESIVILAGIAAFQGYMSLPLVILTALGGSFCGDQLYYYLGRRFGTPLLQRWPKLRSKTGWAFELVRKYETLFILSFRFIYGVRNVSPFVIGMAGVPRSRFIPLNLIAALVWSLAFTFGGYFFGKAMRHMAGQHEVAALIVLASVAAAFALWRLWRQRQKNRAAAKESSDTSGAEDREAA